MHDVNAIATEPVFAPPYIVEEAHIAQMVSVLADAIKQHA